MISSSLSLYRACMRTRVLHSVASRLSTPAAGAPTATASTSPGAMLYTKATRHFSSKGAIPAVVADDAEEEEEENMLEGKRTRDNIQTAFSARARDAVQYEYFAQRAELESETDAAPLFRSLAECARQQAMGYLELMEEYGDASFGATMTNLDVSADAERKAADTMLTDAGKTAAEEGFEHCEEWFDDMADAANRAATRMNQVHSMLEEEIMSSDLLDESDGNGLDEKAPSMPKRTN